MKDSGGMVVNKELSKGEGPTLVQTEYGFYQYSPLPSREQMQEYYAEKYFQEAKGSYEFVFDCLFYQNLFFSTADIMDLFKQKPWLHLINQNITAKNIVKR